MQHLSFISWFFPRNVLVLTCLVSRTLMWFSVKLSIYEMVTIMLHNFQPCCKTLEGSENMEKQYKHGFISADILYGLQGSMGINCTHVSALWPGLFSSVHSGQSHIHTGRVFSITFHWLRGDSLVGSVHWRSRVASVKSWGILTFNSLVQTAATKLERVSEILHWGGTV